MFQFFFFIPITILCGCICIMAITYLVMGFRSLSVSRSQAGALVSICSSLAVLAGTAYVYFRYCWIFNW